MPDAGPDRTRGERDDGAAEPAAGDGDRSGEGRVRVKICGVTRREDAHVAVAAGADYVGAILSPGWSRSVTPAHAAAYLAPTAPSGRAGRAARTDTAPGAGEGVPTVGPTAPGPRLVAVLVDPTATEAAAAAREAGATVIQLHGAETPDLLRALRDEGTWTLWKAARVVTADEVRRAADAYRDVADGLLLDGAPAGARGGGHGVRFTWEVVEDARDALGSLELVAAGGLGPASVAEAVARLRPDVVDVSSGVESATGIKDAGLVRSFVRNARRGAGS